MKTKPKLIRVLTPPLSVMMMQHQQHEHEQQLHQQLSTTAPRRNSASHNGELSETQEVLAMASRDALCGSLVKSFPLAPFSFETSNFATGYKVQHMTLHPCKSWTTYIFAKAVEESSGIVELGTIGTFHYGNVNDTNQNTDKTSWVVVQDTQTRQIVFAMSLAEILTEVARDSDKAIAGKSLGMVTKLSFLDQSTLYWDGFAANSDGESPSSQKKSWSYLMIHCSNRILILDLQARGHSSSVSAIVIADLTPRSFVVGKGSSYPSFSSNAVVAVSRTRLLVAFLDGSLKVYDWNTKKIVQSVHWSTTTSGKSSSPKIPVRGFTDNPKISDAIVSIIPANPYSYDPKVAMTLGTSSTSKRQMVVCLTKKESAYLVDIGNLQSMPPLAKMEGGSVSTTEEIRASSMDNVSSRYDAFRDLFFWISTSKSNKSKLLVWDLSRVVHDATITQRKQGLSQLPVQTDPVLVTQFSFEGVSHAIFPGWIHKAFPTDSVACLLTTKDGTLQVALAPLYGTESTNKNPFLALDVWSVKLPQVMVRDLHLSDNTSNQGSSEFEVGSAQPRFRIQSVKCEALRDPSTVYIGTTIGIQMINLVDGLTGVASPGTRFLHFDANVGNMGKSIISVQGGQLCYSPLESPPPLEDEEESNDGRGILGSDRMNPVGKMEYYSISGIPSSGGSGSNLISSISGPVTNRNGRQGRAAQKLTSIVYESPPPLHLPLEIRNKRGPLRNPPQFIMSPSGRFVCCFWPDEMRYEVLSVAMLLDSVTNRNRNMSGIHASNNPLVAGGTGIASFAWVGDEDIFCLLYDPEQDEALKAGINLGAPEASSNKEYYNTTEIIKNLGKINTYKKGAKAFVDTAGKFKSVEGLRDLGKDTGKLGKKGLMGMSRLTGKVAVGSATVVGAPLKASVGAGKIAVKGTKRGAKIVTKKMPFAWGKKKDKKGGALADAEVEVEADDPTTATAPIDIVLDDTDPERITSEDFEKKAPWVEFRMLVGTTNEGDDGKDGNIAVSSLGQLTLRTGNRNPPTILFGGPVLCVGSKFDEKDEGVSYFYTKKKGQEEESASIYVSSGPALPCPDIVEWDEDGKLCAVVIKGRVSVYLSEEPNFVMLGSVMIGSDSDQVISARFIHEVLYCTTTTSIRCIFLGDLSGGRCHLDSFVLASSNIPKLPNKTIVTDYESLTPPTIPMPLHHPQILGYQNGSLIISTTTGVVAVPLAFPLIRIGTLLSAGIDYHSKAELWFGAVPDCDHDALAQFLERRGVPELAMNLVGISLENTIDISMRYGFVDRLEELIEIYGIAGLRAADLSRKGSTSSQFGAVGNETSLVVCVGAYLLSYGKVELVRRIATECLVEGDEGREDAFLLAGLLLSVNERDSKRLIQRSVENVGDNSDWVVGPFVRKHIL